MEYLPVELTDEILKSGDINALLELRQVSKTYKAIVDRHINTLYREQFNKQGQMMPPIAEQIFALKILPKIY